MWQRIFHRATTMEKYTILLDFIFYTDCVKVLFYQKKNYFPK